jgi:hypothetical protein
MQYWNFICTVFKQLLVICLLCVKHVSELKECSVVCLSFAKTGACWQISVKHPTVKCSWKSVLHFPSCPMHMYKEEFSWAICKNERVLKNCQTSLLSLHFWAVDVCRNIFDLIMFQHIFIVLVHLMRTWHFYILPWYQMWYTCHREHI